MTTKQLVYGVLLFISIVLFVIFVTEIVVYQDILSRIWLDFSVEQRNLVNINLSLMDLKIMLSLLCIIIIVKEEFN